MVRNSAHDRMDLFYSDDLFGPWIPHAKNPVFKNDPEKVECGGGIFQFESKIYRLAQSAAPYYGAEPNSMKSRFFLQLIMKKLKLDRSPFCALSETAGISMGCIMPMFTSRVKAIGLYAWTANGESL